MQPVTTFCGLVHFLSHKMIMHEDYQPYIVRELSHAPLQQAALQALSASYSSTRNATKALRKDLRLKSAARVLEGRGVVSFAGEVIRLNANLNRGEHESIALLCDQRILDYNASHRQFSA